MKKALIVFLCMMLLAPTALANSWGLKGELLTAVSRDDRWDSYTTHGKQSGNAAVMHSRYHNVLMMWENDELKVYTTAVYQPEDDKDTPVIKWTSDELTIAYGVEHYTFRPVDERWKLSGAWCGTEAGISEHEDGWGYWVWTDHERVRLSQQIWLEDFNIHLLPHTLDEARRLNQNRAELDSGADVLYELPTLYEKRSETVPVYSAPFGKSAWRASKGKAAVSLKGDTWVLGSFTNADGERYDCVKYDVSQRTQRIGYIATGERGTPTTNWISVPVIATEKTFLTDDPDVSQFKQFTVPEGTQLICMGMYGNNYAYVAAEVKNGKFVDGGQIVWGFVPLKHLRLDPMGYDGTSNKDVMAALAGNWTYSAGGSMGPDHLTLNADGTFITNGSVAGTWYVRDYNSSWNLYWDDVPYELALYYDDGRVNIKGLMLHDGETEEGFSLLNWEGSGGYSPAEESYYEGAHG